MVEIKSIDLVNNKVTYADFTEVTHSQFYDRFVSYWNNRIAGETVSPFDMERFMKRGSSKNLKQLLDGKKQEGFMEASIGKKLDPGLMRIIIIGVIVGAGCLIAVVVMKQLGLF
jgi:hypothetical protein